MDLISHILVGKIISLSFKKKSQIKKKKEKKDFFAFLKKKKNSLLFWCLFFSIAPDLLQPVFYFFLGCENNRFLFIPQNSDWSGARSRHPFLSVFTIDIPHSFLFAFLIILPLILIFKLPKRSFLAYLFHILADIPTHTGEWAIKVFYPFNFSFNGFTDAWAWSLNYMFSAWLVLIGIIIAFNFLKARFFNNYYA